ncbi:GNAT family N-acetyltransferase [Patescibacteria group bacterium]|nr:GNAT family N-acetyltransferase [Patescibacteria group bacterium]
MNISIETGRLVLAPISREYAPVIFKEFTPEITTFMYPKPAEKIEDTYQFIDGAMEKDSRDEQLQMVILDKTTREFLGCAGLHEIKTRTPELGIWLKKSVHGSGLGREAVAALADWAQKNLDFDYLMYPVDKRNIPSRKIPESLGAVLAGELKQTNLSGRELDEVVYHIPKVLK